MPYLNKPKREKKKHAPKSGKNLMVMKNVYNTSLWRKLREWKLSEEPLCEICKKKDIITPACEVHHKIPIMEGNTIEEIQQLGFDPENLMSLCQECHRNIHNDIRKHK